MKRFMLVLVMLSAVLLVLIGGACTPATETDPPISSGDMPGTAIAVEGGTYWRLSPAQFRTFTGGDSVFMVGVYDNYLGEFANSDLVMSVDSVLGSLHLFPADKDTHIAVYCASGYTSKTAAAILAKAGYTHVAELSGGMDAWERQGYTPPRITNPPATIA